jgi:CHAT domain-containing protein
LKTDKEPKITGDVDMKNATEFLLETLQWLEKSKGNPQQIYSIWEQQQAQLNSALLSTLPQVVAQLYEQKAEQETNIADQLVTFGSLIVQFPLGTRWLNIELGISAYNQALQVYTRDAFPQQWITIQNNLAVAYRNRIQGDRVKNLERAIDACIQALQVATRDTFPEQWAMLQSSLANIYNNYPYDRVENLERAISAYEQALQIYTRDTFPARWATMQNNLAITYSDRIRGDRAENLERAISAYEQALQVRTRDAFPQQWAETQDNLATAYAERIRGERASNLEQAIVACERALQVYTRDTFPAQWAGVQNNLVNIYNNRIQGNRGDNLEQAIIACEQALQVYTRDALPAQWAMAQTNLANVYNNRIRCERADNLEQAIAACEQALQVFTCEAFPAQWAGVQNNLANAYRDRIRGERTDNLERAIAAYEQALQVYTRDAFPEQWAMTQTNWAITYLNRIQGERTDNLERAISAYGQALQVYTRDAFPEQWATIQNNLTNAYLNRIQGERTDNLERAITACEQALQVTTRDAFPEQWAMTQNNLAIAYLNRIQGERTDNLERAITACEQALQVRTYDVFPRDCRQTARNLGDLHFQQQSWSEAANAYEIALSASETLYQACILLDGKAAELATTADLPRRTAYSLAHIDNLQKAVEVVEQGRARGLSETLDRDRANLTQLQQAAPHLYDRYQDITNQLRNLESQQRGRSISSDRHSLTPETFRNTATQLRSQLETTIAQIRQVEGYEDFLDQPNFEDIHASLQPKRPLIYLVVTSAGSLALIITPDGIANLWLDDLTEANLQELLQTWFKAYNQFQRDRQNWLNEIDSVTHQLWQPLMEPLVRHLKAHNFDQAILVPTGYLSLLPLHAAWTEDSSTPTERHYALDDIHFTYAPNARSLAAAQAITTRTQVDSILAIDNPTQDLPNSEREVQAAIAYFSQHPPLRNREATISSVREVLQHCNILHLSCHGTANLQEPLTSGLLMSDGLLTLKDILDLNLAESATGGIRLAILSACETGLSGIENADEAISLPTGLLQAGVAGVIASLWAVSDLSTMLLITKFYDLWREQNLPPDQALRQAQIWLRDTTEGEIAALLGYRTRTPTHRPFDHPYYWSAFSYTGI